MADYLHGVEIKEISQGQITVKTVATSIIGLVGIAASGKVGEPVLITGMKQAEAEFGKDVNGTTIISALRTIFDNGGAACVVVNVAKSADMGKAMDAVTKKTKLKDGKYVTQIYEKAPVDANTDFVNFTADIVAGLEQLLNTEAALGIKPKIVIAPGFSQVPAVLTKMASVAGRLKAKAIADIAAESVADALTARGTAYNTSDNRIILCFPKVVRYNDNEALEQEAALSQYYAAGIAKRDAEKGYWWSPSNQELAGILKTILPISCATDDPLADSNLLNGKGICTLFRTYGTGFRLWGNWTAAFPASSDLKDMIAPGRVSDVINDSIQKASLAFVDQPITAALIEYVRGSVNAFISTLKSRGAVIDGSCIFDKEKNSPEEIAVGHITFTYSFAPPASLDKLSFESFVDVNLLKTLLN